MHVYLDASALAKRYAPEIGTDVINHLFRQVTPDRMIVFNLGLAEVVSLLVRKRNDGRISRAVFSQAMINFGAEVITAAGLHKIAADNSLVVASLPLINQYAINATDAALLRSALDIAAFLQGNGETLMLVASDQRLLKAAQAEGLLVFDPQTDTMAALEAALNI